jgi:hypothetical protein
LLKIFQIVCEAVAVLHSSNPPIFHRDLKVGGVSDGLSLSLTLPYVCRSKTFCSIPSMATSCATLAAAPQRWCRWSTAKIALSSRTTSRYGGDFKCAVSIFRYLNVGVSSATPPRPTAHRR